MKADHRVESWRPRVLVAVVDGGLRQSLRGTLEAGGDLLVTAVATSEEARAAARDCYYNVAVLDVDLQDDHGIGFLSDLRQIHSSLQGILLGDDTCWETMNRAIQGGFCACLDKEQGTEQVKDLVLQALERQRLEIEAQDAQRRELISVITHELRSPITSILLSASLLSDELDPGSSQTLFKLADNVTGSARRMDGWIQELSDLSKLRVMGALPRREADLGPLLQRASDAVRVEMDGRDQGLDVRVDASLPVVRVDEQRIEQAVAGLLSVASRSSPVGARIVLEAVAETDAIRLEVHDSAFPIREDILARFSCPYHRVEMDRQHIARLGLGVGLAQRVAELHGGTLSIRSQDGEGNIFCLTLPLDVPESGLGEGGDER